MQILPVGIFGKNVGFSTISRNVSRICLILIYCVHVFSTFSSILRWVILLQSFDVRLFYVQSFYIQLFYCTYYIKSLYVHHSTFFHSAFSHSTFSRWIKISLHQFIQYCLQTCISKFIYKINLVYKNIFYYKKVLVQKYSFLIPHVEKKSF